MAGSTLTISSGSSMNSRIRDREPGDENVKDVATVAEQTHGADRVGWNGDSDRSQRRADQSEDGQVQGTVLVFRDITERRHAEGVSRLLHPSSNPPMTRSSART